MKLWCSELLSSILTMKIVMCIYEKAHHFVPLRIPLRERETIKITKYIKEMARKNAVFPYFLVVKKNEKQRFLNLITRRSSVQIWLPQPKSAVNSLFYGTIFLHFYRKHDFDPNLTPKTSKKEWSRIFCPVPFFLFTN